MSFLDAIQSAALAALHTTANSLHADFATKLAQAGHDVVMRPEGWWDTARGQTRYGDGRDGLAEQPPQAGATA